MKIRYMAIALTLSAISLQAQAQTFAPDDAYEPDSYFQKGPYTGQKIPSGERRSIEIISENDDQFTVANFTHNKTFYIAEIPKNAVKEMIFQIDYFTSSVPAAHTEVRIILNRPITLRPQKLSQAKLPEEKIYDFVFSIEAVKDVSTPYGLIEGLENKFANSARFISTADKYKTLTCEDKERVTQFRLELDEEQENQFLINAVQLSDEMGISSMYNTWKRNCTTELIRLIDGVIERSLWMKIKSDFTTIGAHYPVFVRSALRARKILGEELPEFSVDPTVGLTAETACQVQK